MVLALGTFLVIFGACYSTPISMNYIIECFKSSPLEVAVIMNVYRQILAIALPFFLVPWERAVTAGWSVLSLRFPSSHCPPSPDALCTNYSNQRAPVGSSA